MLYNVGIFKEGTDVPILDTVVFMEHKNSAIDICQCVGRVMRRHQDKQKGYVIVPIFLDNAWQH